MEFRFRGAKENSAKICINFSWINNRTCIKRLWRGMLLLPLVCYLCYYWVNKSHASFNYHSRQMLTSKIPLTDNSEPRLVAFRNAQGVEMSLPGPWNIRFSIQMVNLRNNSAGPAPIRLNIRQSGSGFALVCHLAWPKKGKVWEVGLSGMDGWIARWMGVSSMLSLMEIAVELN